MSNSKRRNNNRSKRERFEPLSPTADFYGSKPDDYTLFEAHSRKKPTDTLRTGRHLPSQMNKENPNQDIRDKMALIALVKVGVLIVFLGLTAFFVKQIIGIYQQRMFLEYSLKAKADPVLQPLKVGAALSSEEVSSAESFVERIDIWRGAQRYYLTAKNLMMRTMNVEAIDQCKEALRLLPTHAASLQLMGDLYFEQEKYVEAANAYIRLLSIDPTSGKYQKNLIRTLDAHGNTVAVTDMAEWYLEGNLNDLEIQRYMANALFAQDRHEEAEKAYAKILIQDPDLVQVKQRRAVSLLQLERYEEALVLFESLKKEDYYNPGYHRQVIICNAQLNRPSAVVDQLARSAQLFGQDEVLKWIESPKLDVIRDDSTFQAFTERVGGEDFRKWLQKMAKDITSGKDKFQPELKVPNQQMVAPDLLQR